MEVLESSVLNCWTAVMLFKKYKQHVAVEWHDTTCPELSEEECDSYNANTVRNAGKKKLKKEQQRKVKLELDKEVKLGSKFKKMIKN